jgi:hypothetical protein
VSYEVIGLDSSQVPELSLDPACVPSVLCNKLLVNTSMELPVYFFYFKLVVHTSWSTQVTSPVITVSIGHNPLFNFYTPAINTLPQSITAQSNQDVVYIMDVPFDVDDSIFEVANFQSDLDLFYFSAPRQIRLN